MTVSWTPHRFSGGVLALDTANTVVLRGDPGESFDRFDDPAEIARFADAASGFRAVGTWRAGGWRSTIADSDRADGAVDPRDDRPAVSRRRVWTGAVDAGDLPAFLTACAQGLGGSERTDRRAGRAVRRSGDADRLRGGTGRLGAVAAADDTDRRGSGSAPTARWLFVDRAATRSRLWCDMTVCGNRQKARRHYRRRSTAEEVTMAERSRIRSIAALHARGRPCARRLPRHAARMASFSRLPASYSSSTTVSPPRPIS